MEKQSDLTNSSLSGINTQKKSKKSQKIDKVKDFIDDAFKADLVEDDPISVIATQLG